MPPGMHLGCARDRERDGGHAHRTCGPLLGVLQRLHDRCVHRSIHSVLGSAVHRHRRPCRDQSVGGPASDRCRARLGPARPAGSRTPVAAIGGPCAPRLRAGRDPRLHGAYCCSGADGAGGPNARLSRRSPSSSHVAAASSALAMVAMGCRGPPAQHTLLPHRSAHQAGGHGWVPEVEEADAGLYERKCRGLGFRFRFGFRFTPFPFCRSSPAFCRLGPGTWGPGGAALSSDGRGPGRLIAWA
jgi:hypothetical protein